MTIPTPIMKNMNSARDMARVQNKNRISTTVVFWMIKTRARPARTLLTTSLMFIGFPLPLVYLGTFTGEGRERMIGVTPDIAGHWESHVLVLFRATGWNL